MQPYIPMWVMKVSDFLQMTLPLPKHEDLLEKGLLHQQTPSCYCIFVSHQWLSTAHPDPEGKQLKVLQNCLQGIIERRLDVMNDAASQLHGEFKKLSSDQQARIKDAYLWLDWISIPQIVEDSETSEGDESREISGRLRRRSRGLRMSLRSFRYRSPGVYSINTFLCSSVSSLCGFSSAGSAPRDARSMQLQQLVHPRVVQNGTLVQDDAWKSGHANDSDLSQ